MMPAASPMATLGCLPIEACPRFPKGRVACPRENRSEARFSLGTVPSKWHANVANYSRARYHDVYRGIDLVYHGDQKQLEYDFNGPSIMTGVPPHPAVAVDAGLLFAGRQHGP